MSPRSDHHQHGNARAFALPLVLLLALVGALGVGLLLNSYGSSHRAVARQIESYRDHHRSSGVMECVLVWMNGAGGGSKLTETLDTGGKAFRMTIGGSGSGPRGSVDISLTDAQGTLLTETSSLTGRRREIIESAKFLLQSIPPADVEGHELFRAGGPPEISLLAADDLVIRAVCLAIIDQPANAELAASTLIKERSSKSTDVSTRSLDIEVPAGVDANAPGLKGLNAGGRVLDALNALPLSAREKRELKGMFILSPRLYMCIAETRDDQGNLLDRSGGLYATDVTQADVLLQRGSFLSWQSFDQE